MLKDVPETPKSLSVDSVEEDSVTISWQAPSSDESCPITNYVVERSEVSSDGQSSIWVRCATTKKTSFTDQTLSSSHSYQFRVYAENLQGRSTPTDPTPVITTKGSFLSTKNKNFSSFLQPINGIDIIIVLF